MITKSIAQKNRWVFLSVAGLIFLMGSSFVWTHSPRQGPQLDNPAQLAAHAREHGLYVQTGRANAETIGISCFISEQPLDKEQVSRLLPSQSGLTPRWKGVAWVSLVRARDKRGQPMDLALSNLEGHWRVWGNLVVAGEPEFLDRLEELCLAR